KPAYINKPPFPERNTRQCVRSHARDSTGPGHSVRGSHDVASYGHELSRPASDAIEPSADPGAVVGPRKTIGRSHDCFRFADSNELSVCVGHAEKRFGRGGSSASPGDPVGGGKDVCLAVVEVVAAHGYENI